MLYVLFFFVELFLLFLLSRILTKSISYLVHFVIRSKTITIYVMGILFMPGTLVHEVSHYLMARFVFVPAGKLELVPHLDEHGVKLGSVAIAKTDPFRRVIIGVAPFLFGTAIILITLFYTAKDGIPNNPWQIFLIGYIVFEIGNTMFSSRKDMEGALGLFLGLVIVVIVLYFIGLRLPDIDPKIVFPYWTEGVFRTGSIFLLVPLVIDVVVIVFLKGIIALFQKRHL